MDRRVRPALAAVAAAAVAAIAVLTLAHAPPPRSLDGVLDEADRRELAAPPVERGRDPARIDPSVDLTDPDGVARAYLAAAHSARPDDAGKTQRRGAGYARPGSPAAVGVLVLDPPPAGSARVATVTGLTLAAAASDGERRAYHADIGMATGHPGGPLTLAAAHADVALAREPDGRWLVTADSPDLPAGEG